MTLNVGLAHHVKAILVAELVPLGVVGVVGGAHGVDVELLHHLHILHHLVDVERASVDGVVLLSVHALDGEGHAVHHEQSVLHLHGAEPEGLRHALLHPSVLVGGVDDERVEVGLLGVPGLHSLDHIGEMEQRVGSRCDGLALGVDRLAGGREHLHLHLLPFGAATCSRRA